MQNTSTSRNRTATRIWEMMDYLHRRAICNGKCNRNVQGNSFRGAYRPMMNRLAIAFDRLPYAEQLAVLNARRNSLIGR